MGWDYSGGLNGRGRKIFTFESVDELLTAKVRHYFLLASFFVPTHENSERLHY